MESNFYEKKKNETFKKFTEEYERAQTNVIYFLEMFWNKVNPDNQLNLTDERKQELFDKYRGAPVFNDIGNYLKHQEWVKEMKEKGYKDWELQ